MPAHEHQSGIEAATLREIERAERLIASLPADAEKLERLAAVGLLSAFVAHECRNRLTPIVGYARAAAGHADDRRLVTKALSRIADAAQDLANLSELILSTVTPGPDRASVSAAWQTARQELRMQSTASDIRITEDLEPDLSACMAPAALSHVLENLLRNAIAASHAGQQITLVGRSMGNRVSLFLVDSAEGMDADLEASATTALTSGSGGTGLGLALCRYLVEAAGGRLRIVSEEGEGTTVLLELPAADHSG